MKKKIIIPAALLILIASLCCFASADSGDASVTSGASDDPPSAVPSAVTDAEQTPMTDVPRFSDLFEGKEVQLAKLGGNERVTLYSGPGNEYVVTRKINPREPNTTTAYFMENGRVFVHYVHRDVDVYAYVVKEAFAAGSLDGVPETEGLQFIRRKTKEEIMPKTGPGAGFEKWPGSAIPKDTRIRCFFMEENYCFAEFESETGPARAWITVWSDEVYRELRILRGEPKQSSDPDDDIILGDTAEVFMKVTSMEKEGDDYIISFYIENKSDVKESVFVREVVLNGYATNMTWATDVTSGKKANCAMYITRLEEKGITDDINKVDIDLRLYESDRYEHVFVEENFELYPSGEKDLPVKAREVKDTDVVVEDNDDITIIVTGSGEKAFSGYTTQLYLVNKTDREQAFSVEDSSVDGYMIDPYWACFLPAGTRCYTEIHWGKKLKDNGIAQPGEIEMTFKVHAVKGWDLTYNRTIVLNP